MVQSLTGYSSGTRNTVCTNGRQSLRSFQQTTTRSSMTQTAWHMGGPQYKFLQKGGEVDAIGTPTQGNYALCHLQVGQTQNCSTQYNASSSVGTLEALYEDPNDNMRYIKSQTNAAQGKRPCPQTGRISLRYGPRHWNRPPVTSTAMAPILDC